MNVLVINSGSSSFKYQLRNMDTQELLCSGLVERIGEAMGRMVHKIAPDTERERKITTDRPFPNHVEGMKAVVAAITDEKIGVIKSKSEIDAIGHRVLTAGAAFSESKVVDEHVKQVIRDIFPLSPLHNPANLAGIETAEELFPGVPNVAVFDTEFHQTMPDYAYMYPLPYGLYEKYKIRRYGFHGTSHRYVTRRTAEFMGKPQDTVNLITCHLGNGCSITAVRNGKCVDTSMGTTPQEGLMMGTRCGIIDPAVVPFIMENEHLDAKQMDTLLNKQSGFKGMCGISDMRDVHAAVAKGDKRAELALNMFIYHIVKVIGSYFAVLGHVDGLVFTAGIGENDDLARAAICEKLAEPFGIALDLQANAVRSGEPRYIHGKESRVPVLVVPTNEELEIAMTTVRLTAKK